MNQYHLAVRRKLEVDFKDVNVEFTNGPFVRVHGILRAHEGATTMRNMHNFRKVLENRVIVRNLASTRGIPCAKPPKGDRDDQGSHESDNS
jgi:hypothetical protein